MTEAETIKMIESCRAGNQPTIFEDEQDNIERCEKSDERDAQIVRKVLTVASCIVLTAWAAWEGGAFSYWQWAR